ncbi:MAG: DUF2339 domain-containing protein [Bacteroidetes bacterium]|nr:DUF2339 domain-containing protein [Bacteroidota bacterium]
MDRLEQEIVRLRESLEKAPPAPVEKPVPVAPVERIAPPPPPKAPPVETEPYKPIQRPMPAPVVVKQEEPAKVKEQTDWEKFIGENLVSKIGIAILVLAIGFFVKYAIDNDWIGPVGRVGVGVLCGGILIGVAHWLRKSYHAFSSVLVGGGLAALYFTIALAFHQYHLFGQTVAFVIMLVITAFSVLLSLLYDRQELAIIALVGGFITPFLVSTGNGNFRVLFTYLLILNAGLLVIAYNKAWRILNILAFGFTVILFGSWMLSLPYDERGATYQAGLGFATAFYLLFFAINIAYTIRANKKFIASDFGILLINTCLFAGAVLYMLTQLGLDRYKGLFSAVMGVFHLATSWFLFRRNRVDKNILYLFIGITMSFVSLTAPLQLHGHYITLFWASEAVLLYWLFLKSQIRLIRLASRLVWGAMLISLAMDWVKIYIDAYSLPIIFNKAYLTGLYSAIACWVLFRLNQQTVMSRITLITAGILLLIGGILEINYQFDRFDSFDHPIHAGSLYTLLYVCLLGAVFVTYTRRLNFFMVGWVLASVIIAVYLFSLPMAFDIQSRMLQQGRYQVHFLAHWAAAVVIAGGLFWMIGQQRKELLKAPTEIFTWVVCGMVVIFLSAEGQLLVNMIYYSPKYSLSELARVYDKTGLPILWGLCSFAFMWQGMRNKFKPLRIISLVLFSITLLKLFLFDIQNIPIAGKIAAFFCLGVLLLVVSFMYQRLKKIIIEDEEKPTV